MSVIFIQNYQWKKRKKGREVQRKGGRNDRRKNPAKKEGTKE